MTDVAKLIREARQSHAEAVTEGILQIPVGMLRVTQYVLPLCDALEEKEREVERLREALEYISRQAPEHIGGEPYLVSPGGFYRARKALVASSAEVREGGAREEGLGHKPSESGAQ